MKIVIALLGALLLSGCGLFKKPPPEIITVHKTKYIVVAPDRDLLVATKKVPPPDKKTYTELSVVSIDDWRIKEGLLSNAYIKQSGAVDQCNNDKRAIADFIERVKLQYKDK